MKYDISKFDLCEEALKWYETKDSFEQAWNECNRGDWMLWIAQRLEVDIKPLTKAKALCANTVSNLIRDDRSKNAVDVALRFAEGKATIEELNAAYASAADAVSYADGAVAYAAAAAAYAASSDALAASAAYASAAAYAYAYAYFAYASATKKKNQQQTADICREVLTEYVMEKILKE